MSNDDTDEIYDRIENNSNSKKKKDKVENQIAQVFSDKPKHKPTNAELNSWYSHIKELKIEIFIIQSKVPPSCGYCDSYINNTLERKWLKQLHKLLNIDENRVVIEEIPCDWNCLHATEYFNKQKKRIEVYKMELEQEGENYFYAYGMDIEYFPSIRITLRSDKYKKGSEVFEAIFQGLGMDIVKEFKYKFNDQIYTRKVKVKTVTILKPLLRFLRSLNEADTQMPIHEKFSLLLGQTHRHIE